MITPGLTLAVLWMYCVNSTLLSQPHLSVSVRLGDPVTLECVATSDRGTRAWLKQSVGEAPSSIVTSYYETDKFHGRFKNDDRLTVQKDKTSFNLTFSRTESSDAAAYFCGIIAYNSIDFGKGTFLVIIGSESVNRTVEQQPASVFVQPGDSVTLQCTIHTETCAGEHSVHWFRHGSGEALPGLIYTHGNRSDPCESSSEPGLPAQGCVYELPKRNLRSSDAGTYYCAVSTCGQILFGNGTRLDIAGPSGLFPLVLALGVSNAVCVLVIAVLVCTRNTHCAGQDLRSTTATIDQVYLGIWIYFANVCLPSVVGTGINVPPGDCLYLQGSWVDMYLVPL
ncbi:uncharacterized protein LOC136750725 [Amia ocellicauda]|uniref:uncharacterized protein LOC136750725 n=1 Tax=Amia ocellicauda TaxID=2972642 RepID=UPI00346410AF